MVICKDAKVIGDAHVGAILLHNYLLVKDITNASISTSTLQNF
jgi:hypothetical protein